jgi:putative acetyltransferase
MAIAVRRLQSEELRLYLEIVNESVRGLAASHYDEGAIAGWVVPITESTLADLERNADDEVRLLAELDGRPAGIGALVVGHAELRACYVRPAAARHGCGSAIVRAIERIAAEHGLRQLELSAALNAEPFYAHLGYDVLERTTITLPNGHALAAVRMTRRLDRLDWTRTIKTD